MSIHTPEREHCVAHVVQHMLCGVSTRVSTSRKAAPRLWTPVPIPMPANTKKSQTHQKPSSRAEPCWQQFPIAQADFFFILLVFLIAFLAQVGPRICPCRSRSDMRHRYPLGSRRGQISKSWLSLFSNFRVTYTTPPQPSVNRARSSALLPFADNLLPGRMERWISMLPLHIMQGHGSSVTTRLQDSPRLPQRLLQPLELRRHRLLHRFFSGS